MQIFTTTGSEWHSSNGAKGYVFVVDGGVETHIHQSPKAKLIDQNWTDLGRHGRWCHATYDVPEGTILKLFAIRTYRGRPNGGGGVYVRLMESASHKAASGATYVGRGGSLKGRFEVIPLEALEDVGIKVDPRYKQYYREGLVVLESDE